ncbi:MAG: response regulator transcription factor [bacterium]
MGTKILIADDHQLLIDGLKRLLAEHRGLEVVGVAKDGLEAVQLARNLAPDVALLDVSMPRLNGIDAARQILRENPKIRVIVLSMHSDRRFVQEALKNGALGYVLKESAFQEVVAAIRSVMKGNLYLSQSVNDQVLQDYIKSLRDSGGTVQPELSGREREVLQLLAEGKTTKQVAALLHVSAKTIESHRKQIMDKLGLRSIAELTKYAIRSGLTPLE